MLLHYLVNALSASCTWNHWPSAPINTRLYSAEHVASKYPIFEPSRDCKIWVIMQSRVYQTKICSVDGRRVIDVWCGLEQSTINMAFDHWRRRLWACIHSNTTCELTILIFSVSVTFSVTFVWLLLCYIFHSKRVPATSIIRPTRVFVSQGNAAAKSGYWQILFYAWTQVFAVWHAEKILKSENNC